jgi:hypothetical protein
MRVFGLLLSLGISLPLFADTQVTTQIYDVDYGQQMGDEILVLLTSGQVVKVTHHTKDIIDEIQYWKEGNTNEWYTFNLDNDRNIVAVNPATPKRQAVDLTKFDDMSSKSNYVPTTVADMATAKKYHREGRRNKKDSQCFNRAMIWSYEWYRNHSVRSNKILIFFTRNYIRRVNFEWWFHIAPYLHIMENGKVVEKVMDLKYTSAPRSFREWSNIFMKNDAECPVITKYSEYADFPYTGECYLYRTNMYTYQPADLQMHEAWGYTKTSFIMNEVKGAYLEAYDIHLDPSGAQ